MASMAEKIIEIDERTASSVTLVIPCKAEYIALCRLVAGALGAREALDEEVIADLKMVVSEVCACFLGGSDGCAPVVPVGTPSGTTPALCTDFVVSPDAWTITISNPDRQRRIPPSSLCDPMSEGGLGLTIIRALVNSVELSDNDEQGSIFRLVKRLSPTRAEEAR